MFNPVFKDIESSKALGGLQHTPITKIITPRISAALDVSS